MCSVVWRIHADFSVATAWSSQSNRAALQCVDSTVYNSIHGPQSAKTALRENFSEFYFCSKLLYIMCSMSSAKRIIYKTSRPCRTLFGYCPPPALGSRKADMKTLSFFFPTPYPCHVARKQLSSPDIMGGRAACACALHSFLLCPEHDNGWVRWRTLLIPTNTSK